MKQFLQIMLTIFMLTILVACGADNTTNEPDVFNIDITSDPVTFTAEIINILEDIGSDTYVATVHVVDQETSALTVGQQTDINLNVNPDESFAVGDIVRVGFDGMIMESAPVQIRTESVEKIER